MYRMAHFPPHISTRKLAAGTSYPWYPAAALNSSTPLAALGAFWELQGDVEVGGGNAFIYVRAGEALALGDVVGWETPPAASTITAAGSTVQTLVYAAGGLTVNAEVGNWLFIASSGSDGNVLRKIRSNTATTITISAKDPNSPSGAADVDALAVVPTNGDVCQIIRPFRVTKVAKEGAPIGVALGTVTDKYYTIIHVAGLGLGQVDGDTTDVTVNLPLAAAAGVLYSAAAAAVSATAKGAATFIAKSANTGAKAIKPIEFNCIGNL